VGFLLFADIIFPMRIAIDTSPLFTGHESRGIGAYTKNLVEEFKSGKWDFDFVFFDGKNYPADADLVHYPYFDLYFRTLPLKRDKVRIVTIHDVIPLVFPQHYPAGLKGRINFFFQKFALKNVDAVICDSRTSKEDIANKLSVPKSKIHVVYLAASPSFKKIDDQNFLNEVSKKYKLPKKFVLYVGDVNWHKNIENMLKAVKIAGCDLVIVGRAMVDDNIPQTREINGFIAKLGLNKRIIKTGFIEENDLAAIHNLAKFTLLPSYYEGFGLPVLESMACGTPVVASNVASIPEISKDNIFFCEPTDPRDIAKKIKEVFSMQQDKRDNLSRKLIDEAKKFSWHRVAAETANVYRSAINFRGR